MSSPTETVSLPQASFVDGCSQREVFDIMFGRLREVHTVVTDGGLWFDDSTQAQLLVTSLCALQ